MPLMSERKYAEHRKARGLSGGSQAAVNKAVATGRITKVVDPVSRKPMIDPVIADAQWNRNTDLEQQLRGNGGVLLDVQAGDDDEVDVEHLDPDRKDLLRHKTQQAQADAHLKTMQALERAGELVRADEVEREDEEIARELRNGVLGIYDRMAGLLSKGQLEALKKEIDKALRGLNSKLVERGAASAPEREAALQ